MLGGRCLAYVALPDYDGTLANFASNPSKLEKDRKLVKVDPAAGRRRRTIPSDNNQRPVIRIPAGIAAGGRGFSWQAYTVWSCRHRPQITFARGDYNKIRTSLDGVKPRWEKDHWRQNRLFY